MDDTQAIREFLGDRPEAEQLREWRQTLEHRLASLQAERRRAGEVPAALAKQIEQLKRQIGVLREEEAITGFVEDSVRVTLAMGSIEAGLDEG
jgi:hypothetical protein